MPLGLEVALMPKIDKIKADISFHEKLFFGFMAALFAQIAWVAANYESIRWWFLLVSLVAMIGTTAFCLSQYRKSKGLIEELEHVE